MVTHHALRLVVLPRKCGSVTHTKAVSPSAARL